MAKVIATGMDNQNKYVRLIAVNDNTNVIYNNSDSSKYREYTTSIKAYNSAFWHRSSNTQYLMTLLLDRSDTIKWQTSSDNVNWTDSVSNNFNTLYTNVYSTGNSTTADGYYILNFALNGWVSMTTDIPVFETGSEYNDYMSSVYVPPVVTSSGGAGSGYIGNNLLSNKKMVGYNVPTSEAESTKTESINEASENPVSGKPKIGNGHAKIKFLGDAPTVNVTPQMIENYKISSQSNNNGAIQYYSDLYQYIGSDYCLITGQSNKNRWFADDNMLKHEANISYSVTHEYIPVGNHTFKNVSLKYKKPLAPAVSGEYIFYVFLSKVLSDGSETRNTIYMDNGEPQTDEWISVNVNCDIDANYIRIATINGTLLVKDFSVIYLD